MDMEKLILPPKRPKGEDGYKTFSIRIQDELVERINDLAARSGYSRNELIGKLLDFAVDRCDIEEAK
jgi:predicted transcriptional regulator